MGRHDDLLAQGPREAPEPDSGEARTAGEPPKKKSDLRTAAIALVRGLLVFAIPLLFLVPKWGGAVALLLAIVFFGLRVYGAGRRFGGKSPRRASPLRPLVIVFVPITVASLVLAILSGFQPGDWIVVAVPAGILACLWLFDRTILYRRTSG